MSDEFEKTFLEKTERIKNKKINPYRIHLIASIHKQFNHQYNKCHNHHSLRSSCKSCSSLRPGILHRSNLSFTPNKCHTSYLEFPPASHHIQSFSNLGFTFNQYLVTILPKPGIFLMPRSTIHNQPALCQLPEISISVSQQIPPSHVILSLQTERLAF